MQDSKTWLESKTVWAGIAAVVIGAIQAFGIGGIVLDESSTTQFKDLMISTGLALGTLVSGVMAIVGRFKAKSVITKVSEV